MLNQHSDITYVTGDATAPDVRPAVIAHVCNDIGAWGAGFVKALSVRYPTPEARYREWYRKRNTPEDGEFRLGAVQFVELEGALSGGLWVANMVAQRRIRSSLHRQPIRYEALAECLAKVADFAAARQATVVGPRFGAGLAGGNWREIERIIRHTLTRAGVPVVIYDLP